MKTPTTEIKKEDPSILLVSNALPDAFRKTGPDNKMKAEVVLPKVQGNSGGIQAKTFTHLEQQDKVMMLMPVLPGEPTALTVTVNDVCYVVKRGVPQLVPHQVAEMLNDRLASEGYLIDQARVSKERLKAGGISVS